MKKWIIVIFSLVTILVACSNNDEELSVDQENLDLELNERMEAIIDKQKSLGNTDYERYEYPADEKAIDIEYSNLDNTFLFNVEIGDIDYSFIKENDEYVLKFAYYRVKNIEEWLENESEATEFIMDELSKEYGEPKENYLIEDITEAVDEELFPGIFEDEKTIISYDRSGGFMFIDAPYYQNELD